MCFHLIVYIPLRRLSPYSICIVARGFCANNRVSAYAWPVFTEPNGPIRHRQRKRNTENDVLLSQYRPFSLYLFAASSHRPASFLIASSYWIQTAAADLALIVSLCGGALRKLEHVLSTSIPHAACLLLILQYERPWSVLLLSFSVGKFLSCLTSEGALPCSVHKRLPLAPILSQFLTVCNQEWSQSGSNTSLMQLAQDAKKLIFSYAWFQASAAM
jgi:hypothetical protein